MNPFGITRSRLTRTHAFITPGNHLQAPLAGWTDTQGVILISPPMGARFTQFVALMDAGATAGRPLAGIERFVFVEEGQASLQVHGTTHEMNPGGYAYLPPDTVHALYSQVGCRLTLFERRFLPLTGSETAPEVVISMEQAVPGDPLFGDEGVMVQPLLPLTPEYDMAVNLLTFVPGATLPLVEVHVMEHGLLMLQGQGIYRLNDDWYTTLAGDVIWMASHCPQWFAAVGKVSARYLLYKDVGRDPLADTSQPR